jgi:hypothetical protein
MYIQDGVTFDYVQLLSLKPVDILKILINSHAICFCSFSYFSYWLAAV